MMYIWHMKTEKKEKSKATPKPAALLPLPDSDETGEPDMLKEAALACEVDESPMIRTQST
jgi:hypothetical protein